MQNYVRGKDAAPDNTRQGNAPNSKASFEDLKAQPPKSRASRSNQGNQRVPVKRSSRAQSGDRREPGANKAFYDTDDSSIGRTSTTASVKQNRSASVQAQLHAQNQGAENGHQRSDSVPGSGDEEESGSDDVLDDDPLQPRMTGSLTEKQRHLMVEEDRRKLELARGRSLPQVKGDSYPDTTSGRLSVADGMETRVQVQHQKAPAVQNHQRHSAAKTSAAVQNVQNSAQLQQPPPKHHQVNGNAQQGMLTRPEGLGENVVSDVNAGFKFGQAPPQKMPIHGRPTVKQQQQHQNPSQRASVADTAPSTNTAQRASLPAKDSLPDHSTQQPQYCAKPKPTSNVRSRVNQVQNSPAPNQTHTSAPAQQHFVEADLQSEHLSDADAPSEGEMLGINHSQERQEEREAQLDYDPQQLFAMDYKVLKAQSFDEDPNREKFELQEGAADHSLSAKLSIVSTFHPEDQSRFFASLSINEWEETGDWFLTRFGEFIGKLKTARQQKRQAAGLFEDEIERREKSISRKRKQTEEALSEMRESGGRVLQGTPKKMRNK